MLVLCMLAAVLPIPAGAYVGNIPGVDYTRIEYNTILDQEVKFTIGEHQFTGKLSNGWGGIYTGVVQINVNHDMKPFDQQFMNSIALKSSSAFCGNCGARL